VELWSEAEAKLTPEREKTWTSWSGHGEFYHDTTMLRKRTLNTAEEAARHEVQQVSG